MLLVLARPDDVAAFAAVEHWRAAGRTADVITPADLARPGWRMDGDDLTVVVGGEPHPASEIRGVVTRLFGVDATDLEVIHAEDRAYAAAEIHAFLLAWLTRLARRRIPVLNLATPACLAGTLASSERWTRWAAEVGFEISPVRREVVPGQPSAPPDLFAGEYLTLHVVADTVIGEPDDALGARAKALARKAAASLVRVFLQMKEGSRPRFLHADYLIDLADPEIAAEVSRRCP